MTAWVGNSLFGMIFTFDSPKSCIMAAYTNKGRQMSKVLTLMNHNGRDFWATIQQAEFLAGLKDAPRGGIGTVRGYKPESDWLTVPTVNIQGIFRFSTERLYKRKAAALNSLTFGDVADGVAKDPKLSALSDVEARTLFAERLASQIASLEKTLSGDRNDSYREAHDLFYVGISEGVKVHLASTKSDSDGLKHLVLIDGHPVADSIMVSYLELSREYIVPGSRKTVNSGAPVRMGNLIENALNSRSVGYRALSLKPDNFESFAIGGTIMESADLTDNKVYKLIAELV